MIRTSVRAEGVIDLADEIDEAAEPILVELMDQATDLFYKDVTRRLSRVLDKAAEPGESPRKIKGVLLASIKKAKSKVKGRAILGGIYTNHPGAALLEYGGVVLSKSMTVIGNVRQRVDQVVGSATRLRMKKQLKDLEGSHQRKAHPFLRPSEMAMETQIRELMEDSFNAMG